MKILKNTFVQILLLAVVLVSIGFINGTPFILGDGYGYFHVAKNLATTGGFVSTQQPEYFPYTGHTVYESDNKFISIYQSGNAILWYPFLKVSSMFDSNTTIYNNYYKAFNGHSLADGIAILTASIFYSFLTILLIIGFLKDLGFSKKQSIISTILVYLSSYILAYIFQYPAYSHVVELFAISALLFCFTRYGKFFKRRFMVLSGIFAGLLVLSRPIDILIVIPIFLFSLKNRKLQDNLIFILGGIPCALIYIYFNYSSFGTLFSSPQAGQFSISSFNLLKLLFSDVRGWFFYSPILLVGLIGLIHYARRNLNSIILYLFPVLLLILAYSFWPNWWAGDSIGQRFFIILLPFMALGLAYSLKKLDQIKFKKLFLALIILLTFYSFSILVLYRFTPTINLYKNNAATAQNYPEVTSLERFTPIDIVNYHLSRITNNGVQNYTNNFKENFNGARSLLLLTLGQTDPIIKLEKIGENEIKLHFIPNNVNAEIIANINIIIKFNNAEYIYQIERKDFSTLSEGIIKCNETNCQFDNVTMQLNERAYSDEIISQNKFIKLNEDFSISLTSDSKIKFVDYRLKE